MTFRKLDPALIAKTADRLAARIADRFPEAGLAQVAADLAGLAHETGAQAAALARPILWLRASIIGLVVAGGLFFAYVGTILPFQTISTQIDSVESIEASLNTIILAGLGLLALSQMEIRIKRQRVGRELHALRSLVHVIDMHQLTKDPSTAGAKYQRTKNSPERRFTPEELGRYLDYCSEMISVTGKLAALFAQAVNDSVVAEQVNDIENLGGSLSRKIWQKITLIETEQAGRKKKAAPEGTA